ncbi:ABC transporter substrate-binding protein [Aureimonas populi]|uniref:ABC transporter substrate-binding protein n=1 Tax=Aureimonas populi TaxID=1701758 RepID=A0ABW5CL48_9HYPH|nr:ABC transporter substrate-binding protein [Aureimonas populi]
MAARTASALLACLVLGLPALALPASAQPRTDLVLGMISEPPTLDPSAAAPITIGQVVWQNLFEGLTRVDRDGAVVPQLAESWSVSQDGLAYTFTLREGVTFHNGQPFNAGSARYTIERILAEGSTNPQRAAYAVIEAVETPDDRTLVLRLSRPSGDLPFRLAQPAAVMVEETSSGTNGTEPVGTGPFRFSDWRRGNEVTLTRSPDYWDEAGAARLEQATFRFIPDPQAAAAALQAGDVDAFPLFPAPELYPTFEADERFQAEPGLTQMKVVAGLNSERAPLDDPRVRQALMMAVDRQTLIEAVASGFGLAIGSHHTPSDPGYADLTGVHSYDPEAARALLAEAGYPDGFPLTIKAPQMPYAARSAEILQALLAEVGVQITIQPTEFPASWVQQVLTERDYEMTIIAHGEPLDIGIYARDPYYFNYRNPAFDETVAAAGEAVEEGERARLYGEAQAILAEDVPALFLYLQPKLSVWRAGLEGYWIDEPVPSNDLTEVRWTE